jgi:hypothetical protein
MTKEAPMNKEKSAVLRMHPKTYARLQREAQAQGMNFSAFVRNLIYDEYPELRIYEDVSDILAEGDAHATRPAEYMPYVTAAIQRVMAGIGELEAQQAAVDRKPDKHRQAIAELKVWLQKLEGNLQQHRWTEEIAQWFEKDWGDQ